MIFLPGIQKQTTIWHAMSKQLLTRSTWPATWKSIEMLTDTGMQDMDTLDTDTLGTGLQDTDSLDSGMLDTVMIRLDATLLMKLRKIILKESVHSKRMARLSTLKAEDKYQSMN